MAQHYRRSMLQLNKHDKAKRWQHFDFALAKRHVIVLVNFQTTWSQSCYVF